MADEIEAEAAGQVFQESSKKKTAGALFVFFLLLPAWSVYMMAGTPVTIL